METKFSFKRRSFRKNTTSFDSNNNNNNNNKLSAKFNKSPSDLHSQNDSILDKETIEEDVSFDEQTIDDIDKFFENIDEFTNVLSSTDDKSNPPEVPDVVEIICKIVLSRISRYNSSAKKFGETREDDAFFIEAVQKISKLKEAFGEFPSDSSISSSLNRTGSVLNRAIRFLEEEFRALLEEPFSSSTSLTLSGRKQGIRSKYLSKHGSSLICPINPNHGSKIEETDTNLDFPGYSPETVMRMNQIAITMISTGHESECCQVYSIARRSAFNEEMKKNLEFDKINIIDDIHRLQWETLEKDISRWIKIVKACNKNLFPVEHELCNEIFSDYPTISRNLFENLTRAVVIHLLDFAEAISMTNRSAEKLFKFLDLYETLRELDVPAINDLNTEITAVNKRIGEAAVNIFTDLEISIKNDVSRTTVPGGAVHPLTRYIMNYLKFSCEYKETLETIFKETSLNEDNIDGIEQQQQQQQQMADRNNLRHSYGTLASTTPFSFQLVKVMDHLDSNLEEKSKLYKDVTLGNVFLMNNGRYMLQRVKGSSEIHQVMGDNWCRKKSTIVRQFHKNYQRETWGKLLQILSHEGLMVGNKPNKQLLKDRFKTFSVMFDDIHKTQCTWIVSDSQLQSELRVSITAVVIPAYRSFVGRFKQYLEKSRNINKYIKYQPEDIEAMIDDLFGGGVHKPMAKKR